jgi:hypothetical protein
MSEKDERWQVTTYVADDRWQVTVYVAGDSICGR